MQDRVKEELWSKILWAKILYHKTENDIHVIPVNSLVLIKQRIVQCRKDHENMYRKEIESGGFIQKILSKFSFLLCNINLNSLSYFSV